MQCKKTLVAKLKQIDQMISENIEKKNQLNSMQLANKKHDINFYLT